LPAGWVGAPSPTALTLGPGQSSAVNLPVTSASAAAPGVYVATAKTTDVLLAAHTGSAGVTYTVTADIVPPSAPTGLSATVSSKLKQILLSWGASSDNVGVAGYRVSRNGVVVGTSTSTGWNDAAITAGAVYTYSVTAYDAAGNVSNASNT